TPKDCVLPLDDPGRFESPLRRTRPLVWHTSSTARRKDSGPPAVDSAVEAARLAHPDDETAVIVVGELLAHCLRVMSLERRFSKVCLWFADYTAPEVLSGSQVRTLVNRDSVLAVDFLDTDEIQPAEEDPHHPRVAIDELDIFATRIWLVLYPLGPVQSDAEEHQLSVRDLAHLGERGCLLRFALLVAAGGKDPVHVRGMSGTVRLWMRKISQPHGERRGGDVQFRPDLLVRLALQPQRTGAFSVRVTGAGAETGMRSLCLGIAVEGAVDHPR